MLTTMLRALGHDRIETASYRAVHQPPARRPGLVLLGMDPVDPEPLRLVCNLCRDDHAPPLVLLFTDAPPRLLHREFLNRATAVLRFPLPTDQLGAALALAVDASGAVEHVEPPARMDGSWNHATIPPTRPENHAFPLPASVTPVAPSLCEPVPRHASPVASPTGPGAEGIRPLKEALEEPERAIILHALQACDWNRNITADSLQICRSTLYHKMRRYGLFEAEGAPIEAPAY
jgi:hypothetical protein